VQYLLPPCLLAAFVQMAVAIAQPPGLDVGYPMLPTRPNRWTAKVGTPPVVVKKEAAQAPVSSPRTLAAVLSIKQLLPQQPDELLLRLLQDSGGDVDAVLESLLGEIDDETEIAAPMPPDVLAAPSSSTAEVGTAPVVVKKEAAQAPVSPRTLAAVLSIKELLPQHPDDLLLRLLRDSGGDVDAVLESLLGQIDDETEQVSVAPSSSTVPLPAWAAIPATAAAVVSPVASGHGHNAGAGHAHHADAGHAHDDTHHGDCCGSGHDHGGHGGHGESHGHGHKEEGHGHGHKEEGGHSSHSHHDGLERFEPSAAAASSSSSSGQPLSGAKIAVEAEPSGWTVVVAEPKSAPEPSSFKQNAEAPSWQPLLRSGGKDMSVPTERTFYDRQTDRMKAALATKAPVEMVGPSAKDMHGMGGGNNNSNNDDKGKGKGKGGERNGGG